MRKRDEAQGRGGTRRALVKGDSNGAARQGPSGLSPGPAGSFADVPSGAHRAP
jgi:hypothetical protein